MGESEKKEKATQTNKHTTAVPAQRKVNELWHHRVVGEKELRWTS
jgi:hypothetical protein